MVIKGKIVRGPYMELHIKAPGKATPEVIIPYGHGRSANFENYDQAEQFARLILKAKEMRVALKKVLKFLDDAEPDSDFDPIYQAITKALNED